MDGHGDCLDVGEGERLSFLKAPRAGSGSLGPGGAGTAQQPPPSELPSAHQGGWRTQPLRRT